MARPRRALARAALLTVAILAAAVACARNAEGRRQPLVIADLRQPATSLTFVAADLGCFAREGLQVEERTVDLGRDALAALMRGDVDVAVAYETPTLSRYLADPRLRVLAALHTSTRNTRLVARRETGIVAPRDLAGKRVGASRGTNADFFLETLLTFAGVERPRVTLVDLAPDASVRALAAGTIDAAALSDPGAARAQAALGDRAVEIDTDLYTEYSLLATRADVVGARRGQLEALLRGLLCAEAAVREARPEAFAAVRRRFPERSEAELREALHRVVRGVTVDGLLVSVLRREADWLWSSQGYPGLPDLSRLLDPSLLDRAEPEAVNVPLPPEQR